MNLLCLVYVCVCVPCVVPRRAWHAPARLGPCFNLFCGSIGSFSLAGATECSPCGAANLYNPLEGQSACKKCTQDDADSGPGYVPFLGYTFGGDSNFMRHFCEASPVPGYGILQGVGAPPPNCKCDNTCSTANNGLCEDGSVGSSSASCTSGSDCSDCGMRCNERTLCPAGWRYAHFDYPRGDGTNGHFCYYLVTEEMSFVQADHACWNHTTYFLDRSARLATPVSAEEWEVVSEVCLQGNINSNPRNCWVGFTDDNFGTQFGYNFDTASGYLNFKDGVVEESGKSCCSDDEQFECPSVGRNGPWWGVDGTVVNAPRAAIPSDTEKQTGHCVTDFIDTTTLDEISAKFRLRAKGFDSQRLWAAPPWDPALSGSAFGTDINNANGCVLSVQGSLYPFASGQQWSSVPCDQKHPYVATRCRGAEGRSGGAKGRSGGAERCCSPSEEVWFPGMCRLVALIARGVVLQLL